MAKSGPDLPRREDLVTLKNEAACRAAGKMGIEGKEYVVRDGDVIYIRKNT